MSNAKPTFTPGPWSVSGVRSKIGHDAVLHVTRPDGKAVAWIPYSDRTTKDHCESHADARLIAQSLTLLQQVKTLAITLNVCRLIMQDRETREAAAELLTAAEKAVSDAIGERWTCGRGDAPKEAV